MTTTQKVLVGVAVAGGAFIVYKAFFYKAPVPVAGYATASQTSLLSGLVSVASSIFKGPTNGPNVTTNGVGVLQTAAPPVYTGAPTVVDSSGNALPDGTFGPSVPGAQTSDWSLIDPVFS